MRVPPGARGSEPRIAIATEIAAPPAVCFDCARDLDLHLASMSRSGERIVGGRASGLIGAGEEVTWRARHLGFVHEHTSRITLFEPPRRFRDEMVRGRFAWFRHDHLFEPRGAGTRMLDLLDFRSPWGPLGWIADRVLLRRYLARLLEERAACTRSAAESQERARSTAFPPSPRD